MKSILFLLLFSSSVAAESFEERANSLFDEARKIEQEQTTLINNLQKSIVDIDKDIASLRDAHTGCLILDDECSHRKHIEWMENFRKRKGQ